MSKSYSNDRVFLKTRELENNLELKLFNHIETQFNKAYEILGSIREFYEYMDGVILKKKGLF